MAQDNSFSSSVARRRQKVGHPWIAIAIILSLWYCTLYRLILLGHHKFSCNFHWKLNTELFLCFPSQFTHFHHCWIKCSLFTSAFIHTRPPFSLGSYFLGKIESINSLPPNLKISLILFYFTLSLLYFHCPFTHQFFLNKLESLHVSFIFGNCYLPSFFHPHPKVSLVPFLRPCVVWLPPGDSLQLSSWGY